MTRWEFERSKNGAWMKRKEREKGGRRKEKNRKEEGKVGKVEKVTHHSLGAPGSSAPN